MKVQYLKDGTEERVSSVRININANQLNDFTLPKIKQALLSYKGSVPIDFIFNTDEGRARIKLGEDFTVNPTPKMAATINEILNENAVTFFKNTEPIQHNDQ